MRTLNLIILSCLILAPLSNGSQREPWNQYSLEANVGFVIVPADLNSIGPYSGSRMDGAMETSMSFTSVFSEDLRLSTSISTLKSSDTLNNSAPLYTANHLDVDVELTTLWLTLEYYPPQFHGKRAKLWYGAGVHAGVVELGYRERLYVPNAGYFRENRVVKSAPLAGAHAAAGICIYPHEQSALCLNIEGRINFTATGSDFDGSLISPAILVGLRWDFGLNAD